MAVLLVNAWVSRNFLVCSFLAPFPLRIDFGSDEHVIPGNIIVRQRGTQFHPGQHVRVFDVLFYIMSELFVQVKIGRDHTIYATAPGFVRFYNLPWRGGKPRRFVGVVLNRGETLPRNETETGRSRWFGLVNVGTQSQTSTLLSA